VAEPVKRLVEREFRARPDQLKGLRALVRDCLMAEGCRRVSADQLVVAVNEACMNIIQHAYAGNENGSFRLELIRSGEQVIVRLTDFAPAIDTRTVKPRDLDEVRPGGLGVHFINTLMDEVAFLDTGSTSGNILEMKKTIEWDPQCNTKQP
jgi:anti-sigma regulatory factor (Ser/Thr protein kinase)